MAKTSVVSALRGETLGTIESTVQDLIRSDHPEYDDDTVIDFTTLFNYRLAYLESMSLSDSKELTELRKEVVDSIREGDCITETILAKDDEKPKFGQKAADKIAKFGGTWSFIIIFLGFIVVWISINAFALFGAYFDPYPFILLNLSLSCLAAIQAPIIMMSQNRQTERDRLREVNDHKVNLKSELEIKLLHEKLDYILRNPWNHLMEIQTMQVEVLQQIQEEIKEAKQG